MDNEQRLKLEMRLVAIEYMIGHLFKSFRLAVGITPEELSASLKKFQEEQVPFLVFPGLDPAKSDLAAGMLEDAFAHLIGVIQEMAGSAQK